MTRALDALAAERRRLPMVGFDTDYVFEGPDGKASLLDMFEHRRQLIVYHFMWPGSHHCPGCSSFTHNIGHLAHLHARDTTLAMVSPGPLTEIEPFKQRMGWTVPWYSSQHSDFNTDCGTGSGAGLGGLHDRGPGLRPRSIRGEVLAAHGHAQRGSRGHPDPHL